MSTRAIPRLGLVLVALLALACSAEESCPGGTVDQGGSCHLVAEDVEFPAITPDAADVIAAPSDANATDSDTDTTGPSTDTTQTAPEDVDAAPLPDAQSTDSDIGAASGDAGSGGS